MPQAAGAQPPPRRQTAPSGGATGRGNRRSGDADRRATERHDRPRRRPTARVRMTPAVRRLVREHDLDVSQLTGSGAGGRVTREDVLSFINQAGQGPAAAAAPAASAAQPAPEAAVAQAPAAPPPPPAPAGTAPAPAPIYQPTPVPTPSGGDTELPLTQMRKGIARKMTQVKQTVPHAYTVVEVDMTDVVRWREANTGRLQGPRRHRHQLRRGAWSRRSPRRCACTRCSTASSPRTRIILKQAMNIGIAVAVDNGLHGAGHPNADQLSISGVNRQVQDLAARARSQQAQARRDPGRHLHRQQHGLVRIRVVDADHQRAGGRHPVDGGHRQAAIRDRGRWSRT